MDELIDEMNDAMEEIEQVAEQAEKSVQPEKKTEEQKAVHAKANAVAAAPMLEQVFPLGSQDTISKIPLEVVKVDGMTVTFKRKDIVG